MRALLDVNVIMDVLFEREEFIEPARIIWQAVEQNELKDTSRPLHP